MFLSIIIFQPRLVILERPPGGATMRCPVRRGLLSSIWAPATTQNEETKAVKRNKLSVLRFYLAMLLSHHLSSVFSGKCGIKCLGSDWCSPYCFPLTWRADDKLQAGFPLRDQTWQKVLLTTKNTPKHVCAEWIFQTCLTDLEYMTLLSPWDNSKSDVRNHKFMRKWALSWCKLTHPLQTAF